MPNDVAVEIFYDGTWHDLVADDKVLAEQEIVIVRGSTGIAGGLDPTTVTMRLNNDDDMLRPSNPESPFYGKVNRGAPMRIVVEGNTRASVNLVQMRSGESRGFRQVPKRGKAWVDVEACGVFQRINEWAENLRSPFHRFNAALPGITGYWPLEDETGTAYAFQTVPGASSGLTRNLAYGSQYRPAGSDPLADVDAAPGSTEGFFRREFTNNAGWQLSWTQRLGAFDTAETYPLMFWTTTTGVSYALLASGGNLILSGVGSLALSQVWPLGLDLGDMGWLLWDVEASYSGGTTTIEVIVRGEQDVGWFVWDTNFSAPTGALTKWFVSSLVDAEMTVGHVIGINADKTVLDLGSGDRINAWKGHAGERTGVRFDRIFAEELGIPTYTSGWDRSVPMGPQRSGPLSEVLSEMIATDDAFVKEERAQIDRIHMFGRQVRYNRPAHQISVSEMAAPPDDSTDDVMVWNVSRLRTPDGADYSARDDTGPMGTAAIGERLQPSLAVNPAADFDQDANWWLRRGTVELPRYPRFTINLAVMSPARVAEVALIDVGDVVEIPDYRERVIRLHVMRSEEVIGWPNRRTITFNCELDQQFDVGVYGPDGDARRYDLRTATVKTTAGPTATTITLQITDNEAWSSTSAYDLLIGGELVGVPVGGMGARTGTPGAYQQVLTGAVRSKNGVVKTLPAGESAHVATPGRWAR